MNKFSIGVYTFVPTPRKGRDDFTVHVLVGDEHLATLDACWPNDTEPTHIHRYAAHWAAMEYIGLLEQAIGISATGILT